MSEETPVQSQEPEEYPEELTKAEAMSGVFTAPGETYETIAASPKKNYWLLPLIISIILSLISTFLFMQDKELAKRTMDKTRAKMTEQFDKNVKEGKMSREDADKALENMDPNSPMFKVFGFVGALFGSFIILFVPFIIYLILLKIMKTDFEIVNLLNVIGLAMLIVALGNLIGLVISIIRGDMTTIGLGFLISEESAGEKLHAVVSKFDIFNIWFYIVIGIGLSKIARLEFSKSVLIAFIPFVLYLILTLIIS